MENFVYNTPTKVYFGRGYEKQVGSIIKEYGFKKIMIQYGKESVKKSGLYDIVINSLNENGIKFVEMGGVEPNPKLEFVRDAIKLARKEQVELILAVGGGSVIDSSKATALGVKYSGDVWDIFMGKRSVCSPVIDLYPDKTAARCFGCYGMGRVPVSDFLSLGDLRNYFFKEIDARLVHSYPSEGCKSCYKNKVFGCFGGCLCYLGE